MSETLPNIPVVGGLYQHVSNGSPNPTFIMIIEVTENESGNWEFSYLMGDKVWEGGLSKARWSRMMKRVK